MNRRQFLALGAVGGGTFALGGLGRLGRGTAGAQGASVPTVDRLVMTNVEVAPNESQRGPQPLT